MKKMIWLDMDGTISDLYSVENWLPKLRAEDPSPYEQAAPLRNMSQLARKLNKLQRAGWRLGIISWCSKQATTHYDILVLEAKMKWLKRHLHSIKWDSIKIVKYGRNKWELCKDGILFDDEERNRNDWKNGMAFHPDIMIEKLNELLSAG